MVSPVEQLQKLFGEQLSSALERCGNSRRNNAGDPPAPDRPGGEGFTASGTFFSG